MKIPAALAWFASAIVLAAAQPRTLPPFSAADEAAIRAASRTYEEAANRRDWPRLLAVFTEDIVWMPPNGIAVKGRPAVEQMLTTYPSFKDLKLEPVLVDGRGDLAFVQGRFSLVMTPPSRPPQPDRGKYLEIWRKQPDGSWKYAQGIFNSDLPLPASATSSGYRMLTLGYHKPLPGKAGEYVRLEREQWKAIHQDLVDQGRLASWKLYAVSWPNGDDQEYDYVTMMEYPSFGHMETLYAAADISRVLGEQKAAALRTATAAVRQLRRTDTLTLLVATDGWSQAANRVLSVHYLRSLPGKVTDLMKIQREHYLPSNEELIKLGAAASWATSSVRYPAQLDFPYTHVSFNGYESLAQMEAPPPQAWREKWSGERATQVGSDLAAARKRVKGQLWRLIDQTAARPSYTAR